MAERAVKVRLTAVVNDFKRSMGEASDSVKGVGGAAQTAEKESSRLGNAGRAIGMGMVKAASAATVAVGALGASAFATGLQYNQLEQNSRAALTTLLGSTEAAHAQMNELGEFVKTALFPREVFIEAQQQLLAFGYSAEDVIPTLAAVQDAVAATGGSAQGFQEVVRILAQVQSTGKLTAETLNQLGYRGINAAQLIGDAMGMTEAEIRDSITAGTLDGREALDALVGAMETQFAGAAELISNTWQGAAGLVSAAMRDIGSALAEPFISKQGGGAAVEWANALSEILYALEEQILAVMTAMGPRMEGYFASLTSVMERVAGAIRSMDMETLTTWWERLGPAIGSTVGSLTAFATKAGPAAMAVHPLVGAFAGLVAASPELRSALMDLVSALSPLLGPIGELTTLLAGALAPAVQTVAAVITPLASVLGTAVEAFTSLPEPVQIVVTALAGMAALRSPLARVGETIAGIPARLSAVPAQLGGVAGGLRGISRSATGIMGLFGGPWGLAIGGAVTALGLLAGGHDDASEAAEEQARWEQELADMLRETNGVITERIADATVREAQEKGHIETARQLGLEEGVLTRAAMGNAAAQREVTAAVEEAGRALSSDIWREHGEVLQSVGLTQRDVTDAILGNEEALARLNSISPQVTESVSGNSAAFNSLAGELAIGHPLLDSIQVAADNVSGSFDPMQEWITSTSHSFREGAEVASEESSELDGVTVSAEGATTQLNTGLNPAIGETTEVVDGATWSTKDFTAAIQDLTTAAFGQEEAADSNRRSIEQWKEQIDRAKEAEDKLSFSLEGNSLEVIDNRQKVRDLVSGVGEMIAADLEAGVTKDDAKVKARQYKEQLEDELVQMGFNREQVRRYTGEIDGMVDEIDTIPDRAGTDVYIHGDDVVIQKVEALKGVIEGLKDKSIKLTATGISSTSPGGNVAVATGGYITGPGTGTSDDIPAWLSNGEYVVKASSVAKYGTGMLSEINAGRFAEGGQVGRRIDVNSDASQFPGRSHWVDFARSVENEAAKKLYKQWMENGGNALVWARSQVGKPYVWGGVGPHGYDCSGFMSALVNVIKGRSPHSRLFATGNFPTGDFARGPGRFMIGSRRGSPGHMSGTLGGTNVESSGGVGVRVGGSARGAHNSLYGGNVWHLRGFAQGGEVTKGDAPFDLIDPRGERFGQLPEKPGVFDRGGYLMPGQMGVNLSDTPERVLSPTETAAFEAIARNEGMRAGSASRHIAMAGAGGGDGRGDTYNVHAPTTAAGEIISAAERARNRRDAVHGRGM